MISIIVFTKYEIMRGKPKFLPAGAMFEEGNK
jgi:hypothetical protein